MNNGKFISDGHRTINEDGEKNERREGIMLNQDMKKYVLGQISS